MIEIKEISLRHWAVDLVLMVSILAILVGAIMGAGINPQINTNNEQLLFSENFNNANNLKVKIIKNDLNFNIENGKLIKTNTNIGKINYDEYLNMTILTIPRLENSDYYRITFNATINTPVVLYRFNNPHGIILERESSESEKVMWDGYIENNGMVGVSLSKEPLNISNNVDIYNKDVLWAYVESAIQEGNRYFLGIEPSIPEKNTNNYRVEEPNSVIFWGDITSPENTLNLYGGYTASNTNEPAKLSATDRKIINPEGKLINYFIDKYNKIQYKTLELNVTYEFFINMKYPSDSYIELKYINNYTNLPETAIYKLNSNNLYFNGNIISIFLVNEYGVSQIDNTYGADTNITYSGITSLDDIKVYGGAVHIEPNALFTGITTILGFIFALGIGIYGITLNRGFNSSEIFLISIGLTSILAVAMLYFIPTLWSNPYTLTLTLLTVGFFAIWLLFKSGKIEFKGEIDQFFAEHGDAVFFATLVITIIQYIFVIFP